MRDDEKLSIEPACAVELRLLRLDPGNARMHDEANIAAIARSLERFGQVEPLLARKGSGDVIGGNARLQVMRSLGWERAQVCWIDASDDDAGVLAIALNRTAELASWDEDALAQALKGMEEHENDIRDAGFSEEDMQAWLDAETGEGGSDTDSTSDDEGTPPPVVAVPAAVAAPSPAPEPALPRPARAPERRIMGGAAEPAAPPPVEQRLVRLHFELREHAEFEELCYRAREQFRVDSDSEAVLRAMRMNHVLNRASP